MTPIYASTYDYNLGLLRVVLDLPYRDGLENLWKGLDWPDSNQRALKARGISVAVHSTFERGVALALAAVLLVPVVNVVVDIAMRLVFYSIVPHHDRDVREVSNPSTIRGRINKALSSASWQAFWQWDNADFDRALASGQLAPDVHQSVYTIDGSRVGFAELQGRRPTMEDRHLAKSFSFWGGKSYHQTKLFGVFDGHGGDGASHFVSRHMKSYLSSNLRQFCKDDVTDAGVYQALRKTFLDLDRAYGGNAGTTATLAVTIDGDLWVANAGDSRTVLKNGDTSWPLFGYSVQQLSRDLKPSDSDMHRGIKRRGGFVANNDCPRVNGCLAVARAIGDWCLKGAEGKKCVSPLPKISKVPKSKIWPGSNLVLACDGLWDVASSRQAVAAVKAGKQKGSALDTVAANIASAAYHANSGDNISVMVVDL